MARDRESRGRRRSGHRVRYAVVGLGHIAQVAVLPAFRHARRNSELVGLVSGSARKRASLQRKYDVPHAVGYERYEDLLGSGEVDAVYIALPNDLHYEYTMRALDLGRHVLCEKPLALSVGQCQDMIDAARDRRVKLMTAYRLHYDEATLDAIDLVKSGRIGEPRFLSAQLTMQVRDRNNIRLQDERGGGPLWDVGIYCINAARSLFRAEAVAVMGMDSAGRDERFREVPEMTFGLLRFPRERLAMFGCSFGSADTSVCQIVGTEGSLRLEPAFDYAEGLVHHLVRDGRTWRRRYPKRDQFGAELRDFADCILEDREPEPSGVEGLADVRVIRALIQSAEEGRTITLPAFQRFRRPEPEQEIRLPPVRKPREIDVRSPSS